MTLAAASLFQEVAGFIGDTIAKGDMLVLFSGDFVATVQSLSSSFFPFGCVNGVRSSTALRSFPDCFRAFDDYLIII